VALVVGLGNPGARYMRTRHNVGWRVVEILVRRWKARPVPAAPTYRAWGAEPGSGPGTMPVQLLTPLTFMNLSGMAVMAWREQHGLEIGELLVVADDVYLPLGVLRMRLEGTSGGHRGLESIEAALGSRAYARLRIGVGAAERSDALREHVLEEFEDEAETAVDAILELAADAVECWAREGARAAMNRFNRRLPKEDSTP
jgi:PTH1 family peptidyl-tRNA hydrolase